MHFQEIYLLPILNSFFTIILPAILWLFAATLMEWMSVLLPEFQGLSASMEIPVESFILQLAIHFMGCTQRKVLCICRKNF